MFQYVSRGSLMTAWCVVLTVVLWSTAAALSTVQTLAIGAIGVALAVVPFLLARRPAQTTTEAIREAQTGEGR